MRNKDRSQPCTLEVSIFIISDLNSVRKRPGLRLFVLTLVAGGWSWGHLASLGWDRLILAQIQWRRPGQASWGVKYTALHSPGPGDVYIPCGMGSTITVRSSSPGVNLAHLTTVDGSRNEVFTSFADNPRISRTRAGNLSRPRHSATVISDTALTRKYGLFENYEKLLYTQTKN